MTEGFLFNGVPGVIIAIMVVVVVYKLIKKSSGGNVILIIIGLVLITGAIIANTGATDMYNKGHETWLVHSTSKGRQMMQEASVVQNTAYAGGGVGLVLIAAGLFGLILKANRKSSNEVSFTNGNLKQPRDVKICQHCKSENSANAIFCHQCGTDLSSLSNKSICKNCGSDVSKDQVFCINCGEKLIT